MNAFVIEQTKEATKLAVSLHQNAEMNSVRMAQAQAYSSRPESSASAPISISFELKAQRSEVSGDDLLVDIFFRMVGIRGAGKHQSKPAINIECTFQLTYKLRPSFKPSQEQINAFQDGNAIFNVWPYCRQYLQDTIVQMGYPPITLPFLRVVTVPKRQVRKRPSV